jgi:hypothetical protein
MANHGVRPDAEDSCGCYTDQRWTEALPLNLIRILTAFKADLQALVPELRIPSELLIWRADPLEPAHLIARGPARTSPGSAPLLHNCKHVTVETQRAGLCSPLTEGHTTPCFGNRKRYNSLCAASHRADRQAQTDLHIQQDRLRKPLLTLRPTESQPPPPATPPRAVQTTRSGSHVGFPARFHT